MHKSSLRLALVLTVSAMLAAPVFAQTIFSETEPNDTKAAANPITLLASGDSITGTSTGTSTTTPGIASADYFLVTMPSAAPGIYQNVFSLTSGFTGTIRGLSQANGTINATSDASFQTSSNGTSKFYTFGSAAQIYYRVTGTASTTGPYVSSFTQSAIIPTFVGSMPEGVITFTNTGLSSTLDSEILIYDANFLPVTGFQNDDYLQPPALSSSSNGNSLLTRTFTPGTYYLAFSNFNTANNQPSPADDDFRDSNVVDFPGVLLNSSTALFTSSPLNIVSTGGTVNLFATKSSVFEVLWASFTVTAVPEPAHYAGAAALITLALAAFQRRAKRNKA